MPKPQILVLCIFCTLPLAAQNTSAIQQQTNPALAAYIASLPAIDNHAHPVLSPPAMATDRNFDALPVDQMEPETDVVAWSAGNPQLPSAWQALWNFTPSTPLSPQGLSAADQTRLSALRTAVQDREGEHYSQWVLNQAHDGTMLANRVAMGTGVKPPRFLWVPYVDALLFPLDNSGLAAENPDRKLFFPLEDKLRAQYLAAVHLQRPPATLQLYIDTVVLPTLERQKAGGAVAEKFEMAYLRSFAIGNPSRAEAEAVYLRWLGQPNPGAADYKILQDYLFRVIAHECGRLGLPVHLHTISGGGSYFSIAGGDPMLLEPIFNDPTLRGTNFVMLHGGWPFVREAGSLLQKPNVYLDLSQQSLTFPPRTLAVWLREWLETFPTKVLFATDGYPYSYEMGWEESTWMAAKNAREALGLALTGMVEDQELTMARAKLLAYEVLRGNAEHLYHLPPPQ